MLFSHQQSEVLFEAVKETFDRLDDQEYNEVTLVCGDGDNLTTTKSLILPYSALLRSILTSSCISTILLPEASPGKLNDILKMFASQWTETILVQEHLDILHQLGVSIGNAEKITRNIEESFEDTEELADYTPKPSDQMKRINDVKCLKCDRIFLPEDSKLDIRLHLAEFHCNKEVEEEVRGKFGKSDKCNKCGKKVSGEDYMKKEHVITEHPWTLLTARVDGMLNEHEVNEKIVLMRNHNSLSKRRKVEFNCNQCKFKCSTKNILSKHTSTEHNVKDQITRFLTRPPINARVAETKINVEEGSKPDIRNSGPISNSNLAAIQSMIDFEDSSDEDVDDPMEMDENIAAVIQFDGSDIDD